MTPSASATLSTPTSSHQRKRNAVDNSPAPGKHSKNSKQEPLPPATESTDSKPTPHKGPRKNASFECGPLVNNESDGEDPISCLANFQQCLSSDAAQAERHRFLPTEISNTSLRGVPPARSRPQTVQSAMKRDSCPALMPKRIRKCKPEAGSRCDNCIIQRRGCDGKKPMCGRCTSLAKDCNWHEEPISRTKLEQLMRKKVVEGAMKKASKLVHDDLRVSHAIKDRLARAESFSREEDTFNGRTRLARTDGRIESLKSSDAVRPTRQWPDLVLDRGNCPTVIDAMTTPERGTDRWTYKDHLDMLNNLSEPPIDPLTKEQLFGHKTSNQIFDNTTKAFENFHNLEDLDENSPRMHAYQGLKLTWEEREGLAVAIPNATFGAGGQWLESNLRERIGQPKYPLPSVEVPQIPERRVRVRTQLQPDHVDRKRLSDAGRDDLSWMDDWMQEPRKHAVNWDDGGRLRRPDDAANFAWCTNRP